MVNLAICVQIACVKNTIPLRKCLMDKTTFCTIYKIVLPFAICNCVVYFTMRQMGLEWLHFLTSPTLQDMRHTISTRWLANPCQGCNHFPHDFQSPYEYLIHNQSEDSYDH